MIQREIAELFSQAVSGDYDGDVWWEAVSALHRIGTREIFDHAAELCNSANPTSTCPLGWCSSATWKTTEHPSNNFPEELLSS